MRKLLVLLLLLLAVILTDAWRSPPRVSAGVMDTGVYLGVWEWHDGGDGDEPSWGVPYRSQFTGLFDMRTIKEQSSPGAFPGERVCCVLLYATSPVADKDFARLGGFIDDAADPTAVGKLGEHYGTFVTGRLTPMREVVRQLIVEHSDPTGVTSFKPPALGPDKLPFILGPLKFSDWYPTPAVDAAGLFQGAPDVGGVVSDPFGFGGGW